MISETTLLGEFNRRNSQAFGEVYRRFYRELYLYADQLFKQLNLLPEDTIQDVFVDIWLRESLQFESFSHLKRFCLIALKNSYKNKIKHLKHEQRYELAARAEHDFDSDIIRAERYTNLYESLNVLPSEYARILQLYLEGWEPENIAHELNIALQTVYNKRRMAVRLLKERWAELCVLFFLPGLLGGSAVL